MSEHHYGGKIIWSQVIGAYKYICTEYLNSVIFEKRRIGTSGDFTGPWEDITDQELLKCLRSLVVQHKMGLR